MPSKPGKRERLYGYKPASRSAKMENRPRSRKEYHTARWTRLSRRFRESHPLCERCKKQGRITPSRVTDHIVPVPVHGNFWDESNWQALCLKCNIAKGNEDKQLIHANRKNS